MRVVRRKSATSVVVPYVSPGPASARDTKVFHLGLMHGPVRSKIVVGIDASATHTAIAAYCPDDDTGLVWVHSPKSRGVARLQDIHSWVTQVLTSIGFRGRIVDICMEGYGFSAQMAHTLGEAGGAVKLSLLSRFGRTNPLAYPTLVAPAALKKFVTGKGNAKKQEMMLAAYKRYGVDLNDDNAVDAYALARVAAILSGSKPSAAYEREVVDRLVRNTEWPSSKPQTRPKKSSG